MRHLLLSGLVLAACSSTQRTTDAGPDSAVDLGDNFDMPLQDATEDQLVAFNKGDELFSTVFRDYDGLGPLYIRQACSSCHDGVLRGPGFDQKMVVVQGRRD